MSAKPTKKEIAPNRRSVRMSGGTEKSATTSSFNRTTSPNGHMGAFGDTGIIGEDAISLQSKITQLEKDLERRQESYISRERAYKIRIEELEEEISSQRQEKTGWMQSDKKISKLKAMQTQILNNVELVQDRTARIMQEQERDLLRAFRARLFDVQTELEKEKSKKDDGAAAWIERSRQLEAEVDWAKEVADRLERVNQTLLAENNRLKGQFSSQEEDRNFLIKQLVSVKKDNARLRNEYTELEKECDKVKKDLSDAKDGLSIPLMGSPALGGGKSLGTGLNSNNAALQLQIQQRAESEERFKEVNVRLRRLLAEERKALQQVRQNYANELKARTDMELLLRQCVEDVRREIARRHVESAQFSNNTGSDLAQLYSKQPGLIPVEDFTQEDRERVLELLLSQERVVSLIYTKTFPIITNTSHNNTTNQSGNGLRASADNININQNPELQHLLELNPSNTQQNSPERPSSGKLPAL